MLASISPLGERGRGQSYPITVAAYVAASTAAGALLGALLGAAGALTRPGVGAAAVVVALALAGLVADAGVVGLRVPGPRRQVDENWLVTYRGWVYGVGFGAQLGLGFTTIVTASATWVAFACAAASGSPFAGAAIGALFGATRAIPILGNARAHEPASLYAVVRTFERARPVVARATATVQVAGATILGVAVA